MSDPLAIRPATADDIPVLHALIESAYRGDSARSGWTHEADLLDGQRTDRAALADILADPDQLLLMRHDAAGCVSVTRRAGGIGYLGLLTVRPDLQAEGIGRALLAAAERAAVAHFGTLVVEMTVIAQRPELIAWYERRGYALTGETRPFPLDDARFGLPRTRELAFVVLEKRM
ncbi:GNAT family N-acetyltransferase [Sphingomonas sp. S1-29]|uniref:GNAT family N-acetyltransferase n=1 Tax=Sphingomonas sp. S1-29 TaxID=2991074 RepID=UPI00223EF022|nr:GNAT family N-acetyltransferase [Sphingomonas sp. S1-29]UZK68929.1 GNAT family N-acetyltransferase [Sphingomonas sp. S1-29]